MSHEHEHDAEPVLRTSPARMARGLAIIGITLAIAGTILMFTFHQMIANPPPVVLIKKPTPPPAPAEAGVTQITILQGASVQGAPSYDPADAKVPLGNKLVFTNADTAIHTATSGTGASDPNSGKAFDTTFVNPGAKSKQLEIKDAKVGDTINYYCQVHPFMNGKITMTAAAAGGAAPSDSSKHAGTLTILQGASVQGAPNYDPNPFNAKVGEEVDVVNADTAPHTATSGTGASDPNSGKAFDTGIIEGGKTVHVVLNNVKPGDIPFYCQVHPFMTGKLHVS